MIEDGWHIQGIDRGWLEDKAWVKHDCRGVPLLREIVSVLLLFLCSVNRERQWNELLAEELGVPKPTLKNKLKAAVSNAYESNDLDRAKHISEQLERKLVLECVKRHAKQEQKTMVKQYRNQLDQTPDPNSDEEG